MKSCYAGHHTLSFCSSLASRRVCVVHVRPTVRVLASAVEVEEVDPMTGMPISKTSVSAKVAGWVTRCYTMWRMHVEENSKV